MFEFPKHILAQLQVISNGITLCALLPFFLYSGDETSITADREPSMAWATLAGKSNIYGAGRT